MTKTNRSLVVVVPDALRRLQFVFGHDTLAGYAGRAAEVPADFKIIRQLSFQYPGLRRRVT
jgi:hypothetical protein